MGDLDSLDCQDAAKQICEAVKHLAIGWHNIPSLACAQPCPAAFVIFISTDLIL